MDESATFAVSKISKGVGGLELWVMSYGLWGFAGNTILNPILTTRIPMITPKECIVPNPQASK